LPNSAFEKVYHLSISFPTFAQCSSFSYKTINFKCLQFFKMCISNALCNITVTLKMKAVWSSRTTLNPLQQTE